LSRYLRPADGPLKGALAVGSKAPLAVAPPAFERQGREPLSWVLAFLLRLILFYRRYLSPLKPPICRFFPSCSAYAYQALSLYGLRRGGWLALKRVARCHPFHPGGYDPVPSPKAEK
jgi:putative membrane protein insertion efficiency factor